MKFASRLCLGILLSCALFCGGGAFAQTTGAIRGTVKDPSGASVPNAKVTATNQGTQVARTATTDKDGDFTIAELAVGQYTVTVEASGFKKFVSRGLSVDIGHVATVEAQLVLGGSEQTVTVESEAAQVETTSTQLGAVMNDRAVTELPLNTRDTYQLLQLQPGVQSQLGSNLFAGSGDPGVVTVNGGRGRANNYMVNGGNANDVFINLPAVQPSPDAIQEFRVLTNTFDAEFGRNSGAVVNVVTKSGTNHVHGDVFEYVRNTAFDAGNFFDNASGLPTAVFKQNQFGGTLGGPIKKDSTFIFGSYEGRRNRQGISSGSVTLPTSAELLGSTTYSAPFGGTTPTCPAGIPCGDFSKISSSQTQFYGSLLDPFYAGIMGARTTGSSGLTCDQAAMNEQAAAGLPQIGVTNAAGNPYASIFPGEQIPTACFDPTAVSLLNNLPLSGADPSTGIVDTAPIQRIRGDQFSARFDHNFSAAQQTSVYYYFDDSFTFQPFSFFQAAGANVPGFGDNNTSRFQQWNVSHTSTIGGSQVNEFRFTYFREGQKLNDHPVNVSSDGTAHTLCQTTGLFPTVAPANCFQGGVLPDGSPFPTSAGITTTLPGHAGVPDITVNGGFTMGNNFEGELPQIGNVFEWSDNYSMGLGKHSLKFGADLSRDRFDQTLFFETTGLVTTLSVQDLCQPGINPDTTTCSPIIFGNDDVGFADSYPDYLLGFVNTYNQGGTNAENLRNTMVGFFAQDSWKIRPSLTLNYGLRWELNTPYGDKGHRLQTFRPGAIDTVFNCQLSPTYPSGVANPDFGVLQTASGSTDCSSTGPANAVFPTGLVFPGDKVNGKTVPDGVTQTFYKSFAPRIGLAWSPGWSDGFLGKLFGGPGKSSVRMGWGIFYNPIEQLVLEQFSAEPPYGGSNTLFSTLFNTPFEFASGGVCSPTFLGPAGCPTDTTGTAVPGSVPAPNPFGGRLNPARGSNVDWSQFRPIVMFGEFQPNLRAQYSVQYNLTIQRELAKNLIFQIGYVGTQGHRLLLSHDLNAGNPQTCLDLIDTLGTFGGCGPFGSDFGYFVPSGTVISTTSTNPLCPHGLLLPYNAGSGGNCVANGTTVGPNGITIVGTRPFSSPQCQPLTGVGCPADLLPVFSSIFVQDTVGNSNYNSLQAMLEKHFSGGLQFQAAYTFSKSIDNASSFENIVNPFNSRLSRALSLFDARHRFVFSPVWELPIPKRAGFAGKVVNGWQISGILTYQTGFPIRIQSGDDTELTTSDGDFEVIGQPQITGKVQFLNPKKSQTITCASGTVLPAANYQFSPCNFADSALGTFGNSPRSLCCGPGISQTDVSIAKKTPISEKLNTEFVAQFFNAFNHTQFLTPDGNFSHTATFGTVTSARDPRVLQFGLKFLF